MRTKTKKAFFLDADSNGMYMSPREFDAIEDYDDTVHYELINGVVIVSPLPVPLETGPNELLGYFLLRYQEMHPQGSCLDYTLPQQYVKIAANRRIADRLIWAGLGRLPDVRIDVPTIAVEFVSERKRDRDRDYLEKRKEYQTAGVSEYWIIDRFQKSLTVFDYRATRIRERVHGANQPYESNHLPGFVVSLEEMLRAADRLARAQSSKPNAAKRRHDV